MKRSSVPLRSFQRRFLSSNDQVRSTASSGSAVYESKRAVFEYLLTHYGDKDLQLPYKFENLQSALEFPSRSAQICSKHSNNRTNRALDLGCAVGGASFELARTYKEVIGIDFSSHFIDAANDMKNNGFIDFEIMKQGKIYAKSRTVPLANDIDVSRVSFEQGDACNLRLDIGKFDLILASNLLCRLPSPRQFLESVPRLLGAGGTLVLVSPYSWLDEYTTRSEWIGGQVESRDSYYELNDFMTKRLNFKLVHQEDVPFLIREHERKFQYGVSDCTIWRRAKE